MATTIGFQNQADGHLLSRAYVNDNYKDINDYIGGGIPTADLDNEYHSFAVPLFSGDLTTAESVIHTVSLPGQTSLSTSTVLYQISHVRGGPADDAGTVKWTYYSTWADAYNDTTGNAKLTATILDDTDGGTFLTTTNPGSALNTIVTNNTPFYIRVSVATNNAVDICATLWFKVKHADGTLES